MPEEQESAAVSKPLEELLALLELDQVDADIFRALHPLKRRHRLYGGQIMAQAMRAAAITVNGPAGEKATNAGPQRLPHSMHGYFLRPGDPKVPAIIRVERTRDGRSFSTRRVVVTQRGEAIFNMDASFHLLESGLSHQDDMPDLTPPPEEKIPALLFEAPFVTWRHEFRRLQSNVPQPPEQFVWFKPTGPVPADPVLHACLLLYESDNTLLGTARLPHRGKFDREAMQVASLDHAMWFHQAIQVDQWLLYAIDTPSTGQARGLTRGRIFTEGGVMIASTIQEGLIRVRESTTS